MPELSIIITAKDNNDSKLKDLLMSISMQTYQDYEVLVITEGDSESAKGIGVKKAEGEFICILASDNYLNDIKCLEKCLTVLKQNPEIIGSYPARYYYTRHDNILNRYFALMGCNDVIPFYLGKKDRLSYDKRDIMGGGWDFVMGDWATIPTLGDNGFFIRRNILLQADIDHYFHIDVCEDLFRKGYKTYALVNTTIWHKTGGNIFKFFWKRFRYADKFDVKERRWRMVNGFVDYLRLCLFVFFALTIIQPLMVSWRGYKTIKDKVWFLHPLVCLITLGVYGLWALKRVLSFVVLGGKKS